MKISYNWLKSYIDTSVSYQKIEEDLTTIGLEVEACEIVEQIPGGLAGVVVGHVKDCQKHPDADKLSVTLVDVGLDENLQIVCGAPNVAEGQKVLVATVGTTLCFSNGDSLKIKKSKIRGVESFGMICAEDELGLGQSHDGIMVLSEDAPVGMCAKEFLKLKEDVVFEIGLTPNRVDAASHYGVARDLYAYLKFNGHDAKLSLPKSRPLEELKGASSLKPATVLVNDFTGAPIYKGVTIDNVIVEESPDWLKESLRSIGLKPINNIVDITNYVLHETGHPLHAFDYDKLNGQTIIVRRANEGEIIVTLDDVERKLSQEDLLICDQKRALCIAGVFGGSDSGVTSSTTRVFIESALFDSVSVRKTSKRHGLKTDASFRFERGADAEMVDYALERAANLICDIAGGVVVGDIVSAQESEIIRPQVSIDFSRIENFIGKRIGGAAILSILKYLDYNIISSDDKSAVVAVPLCRVDVYRECDIVEDILRIYGYNNIELPERISASIGTTPSPDIAKMDSIVSDILVSNGFFEIMNNSLTKSSYYANSAIFPKEKLVGILNPLSTDLNVMRQTLLYNGLEVISRNINRQNYNLKLFELGNVYSIDENCSRESSYIKPYCESSKLSIFLTGIATPYWLGKQEEPTFYTLKGYVESIFGRFGLSLMDLKYETVSNDIFSYSLKIYNKKGILLASIGEISKALLKDFDIKQSVFAAEISRDILFDSIKSNKILFKELPKFPEVKRDLAIIIDRDISYSQIRECAKSSEKRLLKSISIFDVYQGDKIPEGKKQYAVSFTFYDETKTLTDKVVEDVVSKILTSLIDKLGATLR